MFAIKSVSGRVVGPRPNIICLSGLSEIFGSRETESSPLDLILLRGIGPGPRRVKSVCRSQIPICAIEDDSFRTRTNLFLEDLKDTFPKSCSRKYDSGLKFENHQSIKIRNPSHKMDIR